VPAYIVIIGVLVVWMLLSAVVCISVCIASSRFSARLEGSEPEVGAGLDLGATSGNALRPAPARMKSINGRAQVKTG
jgi:hypothetical protein